MPRLLASLLAVSVACCACQRGGADGAAGKGSEAKADGKGGKGADGKGGAGGRRGPQAFPVEVAAVESRQLEYTLDALGTLIAADEALVTARVAGTLEWVAFAEGDVVAADQILAEIEPMRYKLAVGAAQTALARTQAALDDARKTLSRKKQMGAEVATGEEIDQALGRVRVLEAEIAQGKVALELALLNLRDARVKAGVAGVVQARKVQTGQYAQPGTVVATVLQVEPLRVRFALPEPDALRVAPGHTVWLRLRGVPGKHPATVKHVAGRADEASRLVEIQAVVGGDHTGMRPGAFAELTVPVGAPWPAPVVPQTAIRPTEKGFVAYVVDDGEPAKARERLIDLGMRTADGLVEVRSGVKAGERIVVTGAEALRDGAQVRVVAGKGRGPSGLPAAATASDGRAR